MQYQKMYYMIYLFSGSPGLFSLTGRKKFVLQPNKKYWATCWVATITKMHIPVENLSYPLKKRKKKENKKEKSNFWVANACIHNNILAKVRSLIY